MPHQSKRKKLTKVDAIAAWLQERYESRPAISVKELMQVLQNEAGHKIGKFRQRTLETALTKAFRNPQSSAVRIFADTSPVICEY
jgi:hypothetical protein